MILIRLWNVRTRRWEPPPHFPKWISFKNWGQHKWLRLGTLYWPGLLSDGWWGRVVRLPGHVRTLIKGWLCFYLDWEKRSLKGTLRGRHRGASGSIASGEGERLWPSATCDVPLPPITKLNLCYADTKKPQKKGASYETQTQTRSTPALSPLLLPLLLSVSPTVHTTTLMTS